ncbi:hypothetical protein DYB26_016551, partial [Aphanomyces astaci]
MEITTHEVSPLHRAPYNYEWFCTAKAVLESRMSSLLCKPFVTPDVYPVFMFKPQGSTEVTLTPGPGGSKRTLKLNLLQLPFVNAIASTIYKIQGETMESLVVADWKARGSNFNKVVNTCQQGYIAISRLTKRDGFSALKPLTNECIRYFQPSNDTIAENLRLEQLFALYLSRNENTAVFNSSDFNALKMTLPEAPVA